MLQSRRLLGRVARPPELLALPPLWGAPFLALFARGGYSGRRHQSAFLASYRTIPRVSESREPADVIVGAGFGKFSTATPGSFFRPLVHKCVWWCS